MSLIALRLRLRRLRQGRLSWLRRRLRLRLTARGLGVDFLRLVLLGLPGLIRLSLALGEAKRSDERKQSEANPCEPGSEARRGKRMWDANAQESPPILVLAVRELTSSLRTSGGRSKQGDGYIRTAKRSLPHPCTLRFSIFDPLARARGSRCDAKRIVSVIADYTHSGG